jgi:hypothetical protein
MRSQGLRNEPRKRVTIMYLPTKCDILACGKLFFLSFHQLLVVVCTLPNEQSRFYKRDVKVPPPVLTSFSIDERVKEGGAHNSLSGKTRTCLQIVGT